jgi:hypothetical protein
MGELISVGYPKVNHFYKQVISYYPTQEMIIFKVIKVDKIFDGNFIAYIKCFKGKCIFIQDSIEGWKERYREIPHREAVIYSL